jgi:phage shock protein A
MPNIFSRFTEIISSNISAILDKAENPSKIIKLMIGEMEDTLIEIKAACAEAMAESARQKKRRGQLEETLALWQNRAKLAAVKDQDDLARVALSEKRKVECELKAFGEQEEELSKLLSKYRSEIDQLEEKITQAREKQALIGHRRTQAQNSLKASGQMKQYDLAAAKLKLDRLDQRLDRLEAEADLEKSLRSRTEGARDLELEFQKLDDSLEEELLALKALAK